MEERTVFFMKKIKGNYIWWSAVHLAAGILMAMLGYLTSWDYVFVLARPFPKRVS